MMLEDIQRIAVIVHATMANSSGGAIMRTK